ncbi:MAG TPA: O-antigen ligase family protein [Vicinamibacterales bacterium]|nr:O-antigen ligase family protein [Vicinamibacterales bacterium]
MRRWLLLLFLATMAVDWPRLAYGARLTDIAFAAAAIAIVVNPPFAPAALRRGGLFSWPRRTALDFAIIAYIAGSLPAVIFSPDLRTSSIELVRQLYLVAIYVAIAMAVKQGAARTIATGIALCGAMIAALGLAAVAAFYLTGARTTAITPITSLPYIGDTLRLRALAASEAMVACVLAMSVPFALLHPEVNASRVRRTVAAVWLALAALLTYSHSIAGVAVSALMASWNAIRSRMAVRTAAIAVTVLIVAALNFAASFSIRSIGTSPFRDDTVFQYAVDGGRAQIAGVNVDYQTMSYLRIKQVAWDAFRSYPISGLGLDRFHHATEIAYAQGRLTADYRAIDPHSTFFGRFAEAGIVGGTTLIALWITIALTLDRLATVQRDNWIAIAVTAGIVGTLVNSMNADIMNFRFLWVALGMVRGLQNPR